ncbi:hypothetical protein M426DRAFT_9142 [Hypoxylon sp. CI-4A]|nr:hypothetical protein M426DRAFT_9142 [Hypoxylon sp. CI-4A]
MDRELPPKLDIHPPLINSANPWATTLEDLKALYDCPSTGAVTTRTALLDGFPHDASVHQYAFFHMATQMSFAGPASTPGRTAGAGIDAAVGDASLNNMGYSPVPLDEYLDIIVRILEEAEVPDEETREAARKIFIVSVTGSPDQVAECYRRVARRSEVMMMKKKKKKKKKKKQLFALEINLSCPNIPGAPPPAYDGEALGRYVRSVHAASSEDKAFPHKLPWGIKTPPYTHAGQFEMLIGALRAEAEVLGGGVCPLSFVTATNTLGSCLLLDDDDGDTTGEEKENGNGNGVKPKLAGSGIGGMAGAPLHPLALGNVRTLRRMLDASAATRHIQIIGVGGVADAAGYKRMRSVGADVVGVGTALGRRGVAVFGEIEGGLRVGEGVEW